MSCPARREQGGLVLNGRWGTHRVAPCHVGRPAATVTDDRANLTYTCLVLRALRLEDTCAPWACVAPAAIPTWRRTFVPEHRLIPMTKLSEVHRQRWPVHRLPFAPVATWCGTARCWG
jgi:hypothetical protein